MAQEDLCGFIFKSKSFSSGMERVKVYDKDNMPHTIGVGLFAMDFMNRFPLLPVEEGSRLHDMPLCENFIESVFVYRRWRDTVRAFTVHSLVIFHTEHKLLEVIERFRNNYVPLIVPITLMNHYVGKYQEPFLQQQHYLNPHPTELKLRNHA